MHGKHDDDFGTVCIFQPMQQGKYDFVSRKILRLDIDRLPRGGYRIQQEWFDLAHLCLVLILWYRAGYRNLSILQIRGEIFRPIAGTGANAGCLQDLAGGEPPALPRHIAELCSDRATHYHLDIVIRLWHRS